MPLTVEVTVIHDPDPVIRLMDDAGYEVVQEIQNGTVYIITFERRADEDGVLT